jgi:hypothetical protein
MMIPFIESWGRGTEWEEKDRRGEYRKGRWIWEERNEHKMGKERRE